MTRRIERLVESSYSDLSPSPGVEEELLANLPAAQARPRRSWPAPIAALLMIGAVIALGRRRAAEDGIGIGIASPGEAFAPATVAQPKTGVVPKSTDEVHVRLVHGSGIQVFKDDTWTAVSLDGLGEHLAPVGKDRWVVLDIDRDTPWRHVQWTMMICAEQKLAKLAFAVRHRQGREFRLDASLPTDLGLDANRTRPAAVPVSLLAVPGMERERRWGVKTVRMPTRVVYKFAGHEADELASVARWLIAAKKSAPDARGRIRALAKTRFETVARLLAEFRQAGYGRVDFYGGPIPTAAARAALALPYPGALPPKMSLDFAMTEGDAKDLARAMGIVRQRLQRAGFTDFVLERGEDGIRLTLPSQADATMAARLVERKGATLVFHITVERDDPAFAEQWRRRQLRGEAGQGMRWYELNEYARKTYSKDRLPEGKQPYVLCRTDDKNITGASLTDIVAHLDSTRVLDAGWTISFKVREQHQQNMADLTERAHAFLAIIIDGKVHAAPILQSQLRRTGMISGGYSEQDAKHLAVMLGSDPLPVRFALRRTR